MVIKKYVSQMRMQQIHEIWEEIGMQMTFIIRLGLVGILCFLMCNSIHAQDAAMAQRVDQAMEAVRHNDFTLADNLKKNAITAIPYLAPYIKDKNDNIRVAIIYIIKEAKTPEAMRLLTTLVADTDLSVAEKASNAIYDTYSRNEIRDTGGKQLKANLLINLKEHVNIAKAILLLSSFSDDKAVGDTLRKHKAQHPTMQIKCKLSDPLASLSLGIDISLVAFNDNSAIENVEKTIKRGDIPGIIYINNAVGALNNTAILIQLTELLKDKRNAKPAGPSGTNYNVRVCDLTLEALVLKTKVDIGTDPKKFRGFTVYSDTVLDKSYQELLKYFTSNR